MTALPPNPPTGNAKAWAAGIAGTVGTALSQIVIYVVDLQTAQPLPDNIASAVSTLVVTAVTVLAVYLTPHDLGAR